MADLLWAGKQNSKGLQHLCGSEKSLWHWDICKNNCQGQLLWYSAKGILKKIKNGPEDMKPMGSRLVRTKMENDGFIFVYIRMADFANSVSK